MQALDPRDPFHQIFNSETPLQTDFFQILASQIPRNPSPFSTFSTALGSIPRKLRESRQINWEWRPINWEWRPINWEWRPTNWESRPTNWTNIPSGWERRPTDWAFEPKEIIEDIPLGWRCLELSPLIHAFLPAKINYDSVNSSSEESTETEPEPETETETEPEPEPEPEPEEAIDKFQKSAFNTLDSGKTASNMDNLSSTLIVSHSTKSHSMKSRSMKSSSRSQSRFHSTFQKIMSDLEMDSEMNSDMNIKMDKDIEKDMDLQKDMDMDIERESKQPPKQTLITQSTMDFLFGGFIPCHIEPIGGFLGDSIWETIRENNNNGRIKHSAHPSPWDPPKSPPKLWDPFEMADSIPTPTQTKGFVDPEVTESSSLSS